MSLDISNDDKIKQEGSKLILHSFTQPVLKNCTKSVDGKLHEVSSYNFNMIFTRQILRFLFSAINKYRVHAFKKV